MRSFSICAMVSLVLGATSLIVSYGCGSGRGDTPSSDEEGRLQTVVSRARSTYPVPAIAAALIHKNGPPVVFASGTRKTGTTNPVTTGDYFNIGSCGKAMTGTLIALLVKENKLTYGTTLSALFPELAASMNPAYRSVTVAQVLEMKAGFTGYTNAEEISTLPSFSGDGRNQRAQFASYLLNGPTSVTPGTYQYSNASYVLAATIAERLTRTDWETLIQQRVYGPLGMQGVRYNAAWRDAPYTEPWGHRRDNSGKWLPMDAKDEKEIPGMYPAGDQTLPVGEWAKFVQEHLRAMEGASPRLPLTASLFKTMHTGDLDGVTVGGWSRVRGANGKIRSIYLGSTGGFDAIVVLDPDTDTAVVAVTNSSDLNEEAGRIDTIKAMDMVVKEFIHD